MPVAVAKKFREDSASSLAALIAYYAFFSLFPLLLVFVSVLGFVLQGDPSLRDDVVHTALSQIPVVDAQSRDQLHPLSGSGVALAVGLAGTLWAGLAVTVAVSRAFETIWDMPRVEWPSGLTARVRGLAALLVLGAAFIGSSAAAGLAAGGGIGPAGERVAAVAISLAADTGFFLALFALLTPRPVLQSVGGWYVDHTVAGASSTYGTFALVVGLLSWLWVGSQLLLVAAETNVVLRRRLWPRSLSGTLEPADRVALERLAETMIADPRERVAVSFDEARRRG